MGFRGRAQGPAPTIKGRESIIVRHRRRPGCLQEPNAAGVTKHQMEENNFIVQASGKLNPIIKA